VAASQTIAYGDPVILNTTGDIAIAVSNSSAALLGIALQTVTTSASDEQTLIPVSVGDRDSEFLGVCSGSSAMALQGILCDIEGTTGAFHVNEDAGTQDLLQIIKPYEEDGAAMGALGVVIVRIALSQYSGTEVSA
jgi:hypothetical protein